MNTQETINSELAKVGSFLDTQIKKLNEVTPEDLIKSEVRKELLNLMNYHNFEVEPFTGGDATIWVVNHKCNIMGYETVINGSIKYVVDKFSDNPNECIISEDGYFDGAVYVWGGEDPIFEEEILITL